ncbi:PREDICTED: podoplanin [Crocodylus porosus]|uniref:podoplanin n=1 Tax=Crocodylus porosus TaxID=8502 RepID=UPI00093B502D|nr:PREDICTED: podoplanin [Crocodylus porosus]
MFLKTLLLVFLLGTVPFRAFAEEASSVLEDEESTTTDFKDRNDTWYNEVPTLVSVTKARLSSSVPVLDLSTVETAIQTNQFSANQTPECEVEHPEYELGEEPETTAEEDGLGTAALVGIIIGIIVAVGIIAGIIIAVARKMSGRYS